MSWDYWLKNYKDYFSPTWEIVFDVLQSKNISPPIVRWVIKREPVDIEKMRELCSEYQFRSLFEAGNYNDKMLYFKRQRGRNRANFQK